jgi:hypothetical protein
MGEYRPIVNGRASICHWSLTASFLLKEQATKAVERILAMDVDCPVSYCKELTEKSERHLVIIEDMSWANNLVAVAEILRECDWQEPEDGAAQRDMEGER